MKSKEIIPIIVIVVVVIALGAFISSRPNLVEPIDQNQITNFEECVAAGNPVMESFPRQCRAGDTTFTEVIPGVTDMDNMIRVSTPVINSDIKNPLVIKGEARGTWFFEANFPVILTNWDGLIIAEGYATAEGEWMTEEFVPFTATITFEKPVFNNRGFLILQKANAADNDQDMALEIPIYFEGVAPQPVIIEDEPVACTMDAKMCPDGSYVGRQGPKCEFAPCPGN